MKVKAEWDWTGLGRDYITNTLCICICHALDCMSWQAHGSLKLIGPLKFQKRKRKEKMTSFNIFYLLFFASRLFTMVISLET